MDLAVVRNYTRTAAAYDGRWADALADPGSELLARLPLAGANRVLDAGCGPGRLLERIKAVAPTARLVGLDLTEAMLRRAPSRFPRVIGDVEALPLGAGQFDVAVLTFVLFHVPRPQRALAELHRVLRPGGSVGLTTWGPPQPPVAYEVWMDCIERAGAPPDPAPVLHDAIDTTDPVAMQAALEEAGFVEVQVAESSFRWQPSVEEFVEHSLGMGVAARRLELLAPAAREGCITAARRRLEQLSPRDFLRTASVVHSVGRVPENGR